MFLEVNIGWLTASMLSEDALYSRVWKAAAVIPAHLASQPVHPQLIERRSWI